MKSEANIGYDRSGSLESANLIVHQGMANVFHQTVQLLCILRVVEEIGNILLSCH